MLFKGSIRSGVRELKQLFVDDLAEGMVLEQDIFGPGSNKIPLLAKDVILTGRQIEMLRKNGILGAFVAGEEEAELIQLPPPRQIITPQLRDSALQKLTDLFEFFRNGEGDRQQVLHIIDRIDVLVGQLVENLQKDENTQIHIAGLKSYDEYTYHHSLSVSVLAIAIGQALDLEESQLHELGKCAMMHDIGKTAIPIDIINKPSTLSKEEFDIIKRHSPEGYQYLNKFNIDDPVLLSAVLFHHERFDGSGYPYGLKGDKIPLFSRIIAVADVYDALTSHRSYRIPESPAEALEYIMGNAEAAFDYDIICALIKKLELYPVGSLVRLSNGQKAVVMDNAHILRPTIKLLETGKLLDLYQDNNYLNLTIRNIMPLEM